MSLLYLGLLTTPHTRIVGWDDAWISGGRGGVVSHYYSHCYLLVYSSAEYDKKYCEHGTRRCRGAVSFYHSSLYTVYTDDVSRIHCAWWERAPEMDRV